MFSPSQRGRRQRPPEAHLKSSKISRALILDPELSIFVKIFEFYLVTQSLYWWKDPKKYLWTPTVLWRLIRRIHQAVEELYSKRPSNVWRLSKYWPHTPSPPGECVPPPPAFGAGGGHTRWVERGWVINSSEDARHCSVLYICNYFLHQAFRNLSGPVNFEEFGMCPVGRALLSSLRACCEKYIVLCEKS